MVAYATLGQAMGETDLIPPSPDDTLIISCSPGDFNRFEDEDGIVTWFNPFVGVHYDITNANEICAPRVKTMFGQAIGQAIPTTMFILILCPIILNQTDGRRPKMFADLEGDNLMTNNRPNVDWGSLSNPTPITPENTINMMVWAGQHIDQLRDRVLSVIVGRMLLYVSVNKLTGLTGIESKIPSP